MRKLIVCALLLAGCAAQKSPEQIAEDQRAAERMRERLAAIVVTKNEPQGCVYVKALTAKVIDAGPILSPNPHDDAVNRLRMETYEAGANTAVIDESGTQTVGSSNWHVISARLYRCP